MNNILLGGLVSHTERSRMHAMNSILGTGPRNGGGSSNGGGGSSGVGGGGSGGGFMNRIKEKVGENVHKILGHALSSEREFKKKLKSGGAHEKVSKLERNMKVFGIGVTKMPGINNYPKLERGAKGVKKTGEMMGKAGVMGNEVIEKVEVGHKAAEKMSKIGQK